MVVTSGKRSNQWTQESHINWELNERISLSSAGSIRNAPISADQDDSLPRQAQEVSRSIVNEAADLNAVYPSMANPDTPVRRRWNAAKKHLNHTNNALDKRVSLIQELNRKITMNYDKMHVNSQKNRWKSKASPPEQQKFIRKEHSLVPGETKRSLVDKMNYRRRAGGEWNLPKQTKLSVNVRDIAVREKLERSDSRKIDSNNEVLEKLNLSCTLQRSTRGSQPQSVPLECETAQAVSSPLFWTNESKGLVQIEDESAQERSVLRELNEAIDRFEVEGEKETENSRISKAGCRDSSWDSGVGGELSSGTAAKFELSKGTGWLRVHTGIESSLIYLTLETTAGDVCRDMLLSDNLALFIQYGGEPGRRLCSREKPLELQEQLLLLLGYHEPTRRARLGLDAELRHLLAFHVGPAAPLDELRDYSRCGYALVLKGLVFPQWKKRALAIIGSRIFLYPACTESRPEWMELAGGGTVCCVSSRMGKLVLRVTGQPRIASLNSQQRQRLESQQQHQRSREVRHLYLGFHHPWDRDLWRCWLKQACQSVPTISGQPTKLDMSKTGLSKIPNAVQAFTGVQKLFLGYNQLSSINGNLNLLLSFPELQELHLENNRLSELPNELLQLENLTFLDLSNNEIPELPLNVSSFVSLKELILDRNDIKELPDEIKELRQLQHISLAGNLIEILPTFLLEMRALPLTDVLSGEATTKATIEEKSNLHNSLYKVNLRNNRLKGNIILGNYGNLTHLDLSENNIEKLDLSALQELKSVRCARNLLTELTLCGRSLVSLIAGNNKLKKLTVAPIPKNLEHLDVSYNDLDCLPEWTPELPMLRALFASNNGLSVLPDRLLSQPGASRLEVLHLPHNRLQALPPPRGQLSLVHLTLQDNSLTALPVNFFANTLKLKVLNLSNNRLSELPYNYMEQSAMLEAHNSQDANSIQSWNSLEKLYLTGNSLTNTAFDVLAKFGALRILHLAYNALDTLPESCIASWKELEELVLSGNKLQYLPDSIADLSHLRVLRIHSNRLLTCPAFHKTLSLKVLDLAHNHLDRLNLENLLSAQLQFLDISCNSRLRVDPREFQNFNSARRPLSLVDVSGQSRSTAGVDVTADTSSRMSHRKHGEHHHLPWRLGFSETAGTRERLLINQVRMPTFCNTEGLFGLFDGDSNQEAPTSLQEIIPRLLLEERTIKETRGEYLHYTLLAAQRELRDKGHKYGVDATLVHIFQVPEPEENPRYLLTTASCGEARAVLCRASGPLQLAKSPDHQYLSKLQAALAQGTKSQKSGVANLLPITLLEPTSEQVILEDDDEFVIIGNRQLWEVLSIQEAVREARAEANPVLAAKRLQDLGQAYGAEDNLSVLVVRLSGASTEPLGKLLMRELRQVVQSKEQHQQHPVPESSSCTCPCCMSRLPGQETLAACCCHAVAVGFSDSASSSVNGFYFNGVLRNVISARSSAKSSRSSQRQLREDRSSPSGQSDQTSETGVFELRSRRYASDRFCSGSATACKLRQQQQQQRSVSERDPPPSDEQLRCWEYMLEQNTQLLFDKELDTIANGPRNSVLRRGHSKSTPQLGGNSGVPFLSRRFGSARSFDNSGPLQGMKPTMQPSPVLRSAFGGSGRRILNGGPNAAYFGSLQRLMPYNLEYDFAVIQERSALNSLEQDASRMQQYWGVATTEL